MARQRTARLPRFGRTVVIAHRGGGAPGGVSVTAFAGSVLNGKADVEMAIVNGAVQSLTPKANRDWELFDYVAGVASALSGGFGWNGSAACAVPFVTRAADELFDSYASGAAVAAQLNSGTGWSNTPNINAAYATRAGDEQFETYNEGVVSGAQLIEGTGWSGAPLLAAY